MAVVLRRATQVRTGTDVAAVHGSFAPAQVRDGEPILCTLRQGAKAAPARHAVDRLSPFGFAFRCRSIEGYSQGESVEVALHIADPPWRGRGIVVATEPSGPGDTLCVGIRLEIAPREKPDSRSKGPDKTRAFACHDLFYPTGVARSADHFDGRMHFRVIDLSASGMRIITGMRDERLTSGLPLQITLFFPSVGEVGLRATIVHTEVRGSAAAYSQTISLRFVHPSQQAHHALRQYILQFGSDAGHRPSPQGLGRHGFVVDAARWTTEPLAFDVVRTSLEYRAVLELRAQALLAALGVAKKPEAMADLDDTRSRIVVGKMGEHIVATVRLIFHDSSGELAAEAHGALPTTFPPRERVVEASQAAVHGGSGNQDLFASLMRYVLLETVRSGRRYVAQNFYEPWLPRGRQLGFRPLNVRLPHPSAQHVELRMALVDGQKLLEGPLRALLRYAAIAVNLQNTLLANRTIRLNWLARQRLRILAWLQPLLRLRP